MKITIAQLPVSKNIQENTERVLEVIENASENDWIVFPEGMMSGYYPEEADYTDKLDADLIESSISEIHKLIEKRNVICLVGSALKRNDKWFISIVILKSGERYEYHKVNLSNLDRNHFAAGNDLPVYQINGITFGVQICRESAFPEQWKVLKKKGAQIVFHVNNALKEADIVRRSLLISRAFENQYFVASANSFTDSSTLSSFVINPLGQIMLEINLNSSEVTSVDVDPGECNSIYLEQERKDLVDLRYR